MVELAGDCKIYEEISSLGFYAIRGLMVKREDKNSNATELSSAALLPAMSLSRTLSRAGQR
jgi:hypothetical protein